ncbi:transglutaminase-like cysteine peptidase [Halomonas getboli]|uniref:transglutaminase-like cysteine peptidase n=1 Tax=Halomonas getboli TaxID=2935862 RepID=UPI001FFECFF2|nr:transglutaminase-like cysteine peptidase [Halomonas getboli]MCK2182939.1 transglutaminase-like cysteine peptidase [Halomonas getboli]
MSDTPRSRPASPGRRRCLALLGGLLAAGALGLHTADSQAGLDRARLRDSMRQQYGAGGVSTLEEWLAMLERLRGADVDTQLREVNDFVNRRVRWLEDPAIWGQEDYWATPLETLGRGAGDCEDFTIAKYVSLRELQVPESMLRLIYVKARIGRSRITQAHMVLGYYVSPGAEPMVLDNLVTSIRPAGQRTDLDPLFSFNGSGLWAGGSSRSRADPVARLSRWRSVIDRMRQQGFIQGR